MVRTYIILGLVATLCASFIVLVLLPKPLQLPYARPNLITSTQVNFVCAAPPAIPRDLMFTNLYRNDDPARDTDDPAAVESYRNEKSIIAIFEAQLLRMSNDVFRTGDQAEADCVIGWMKEWADQQALLGAVNQSGIVARQSALAALSSAYAQVKNHNNRSVKTEVWLRKIARKTMEDYPLNAPEARKHNNLLYWAAWGVNMTGIALNDRELYHWGIKRAGEGIHDIAPDGTLPLEMKRGTKAFLYHQHALAPLVMLAESATHNGIDLYAQNDGALQKLAERVRDGLSDPSYFVQKTELPQDDISNINPLHLAWLEVYNARFPDAKAAPFLEPYRPLVSNPLGGNMTQLYLQ